MKPSAGAHAFPSPAFSSRRAASVSNALDHWALDRIRRGVPGAPIDFVLWDGFEITSPSAAPVARIIGNNRRTLFSWVWDPELNFGEAYMSGAVDIRGDLVRLLEEIYRARPESTHRSWWLWRSSN